MYTYGPLYKGPTLYTCSRLCKGPTLYTCSPLCKGPTLITYSSVQTCLSMETWTNQSSLIVDEMLVGCRNIITTFIILVVVCRTLLSPLHQPKQPYTLNPLQAHTLYKVDNVNQCILTESRF